MAPVKLTCAQMCPRDSWVSCCELFLSSVRETSTCDYASKREWHALLMIYDWDKIAARSRVIFPCAHDPLGSHTFQRHDKNDEGNNHASELSQQTVSTMLRHVRNTRRLKPPVPLCIRMHHERNAFHMAALKSSEASWLSQLGAAVRPRLLRRRGRRRRQRQVPWYWHPGL